MSREPVAPWVGGEVFCIASGPSLTQDDCERVRQWRFAAENRHVVVVNTSYQIAPWADVLYAMDRGWWRKHHIQVAREFPGPKYAPYSIVIPSYVRSLGRIFFEHHGNSGAGAISFAIWCQAATIYLLGYDCQHTGGKTHWHGSHPRPLGDARSVSKWPAQFAAVGKRSGGQIINCTRQTALRCFKIMKLEDALK